MLGDATLDRTFRLELNLKDKLLIRINPTIFNWPVHEPN